MRIIYILLVSAATLLSSSIGITNLSAVDGAPTASLWQQQQQQHRDDGAGSSRNRKMMSSTIITMMRTSVGKNQKAIGGNNKKTDNILKLVEEIRWTKEESCLAIRGGGDTTTNSDNKEKTIINIKNLPSKEDAADVNRDMIRLCATISGFVYDSTTKEEFKEKLMSDDNDNNENNNSISQKFPDLSVRWYQKGVTFGRDILPEQLSLNAPTFVGVITGSTLILGWRGSVTIKDFLSDASIDSINPWVDNNDNDNSPLMMDGLEIQKAFYDMIENEYFKYHWKDICNFIHGNYDKTNPNGTKKDGVPITRIILTGHSLGGGLAQVAHLVLRAAPKGKRNRFWPPWPGSGQPCWEELEKSCRNIEIKTIAFSAPMTTVLKEDIISSATKDFLKSNIEPDMRNFVFNADVVPRGYAHLDFIGDFIDAVADDNGGGSGSDASKKFAIAFIKLHLKIFKFKQMRKQAQRYRHVGKLIYYDNPNKMPVLYVDDHGNDANDMATTPHTRIIKKEPTTRFGDLKYGPKTEVADTAVENHMVLVTGPGLIYPTKDE